MKVIWDGGMLSLPSNNIKQITVYFGGGRVLGPLVYYYRDVLVNCLHLARASYVRCNQAKIKMVSHLIFIN